MKKITVNRSRENINILRDYHIYSDGKKLGTIANGETKDFDIPSNAHNIYAKIDWAESNKLKIGNQKTFEVGANRNFLIALTGGLAGVLISVAANLFTDRLWPVLLMLPGFTVMLYYLTFGRKKYLILK